MKFRDQLAKPNDGRYEHMGEAETLAVMTSRFPESILATDDRGAASLARAHSIEVLSTWRLLREICVKEIVSELDILAYLKKLRPRGAPVLRGISDLRAWIRSIVEVK